MQPDQSSRKALLIGPAFHNYNRSVADALAHAGFETRIVDYPISTPPGIVNRLRIDAAKLVGIVRYQKVWRDNFNKKLLQVYHAFRPDLTLIIKGEWITQSTLEQMRSSLRVVWLQDQASRCGGFMTTKECYDRIFVFEGSDVTLLKEKYGLTAHFLPMGFDPAVYHPMPQVAKDIDILFVGFPYRPRRQTIERLLTDFPEATIRAFGRYVRYKKPETWVRYVLHRFDPRRRRVYVNRDIPPTEVNHLYARSRIALNIHHSQSREGCNPRVFEIMGSGAFQLVDAIPFLRDKTDWGICMYENYDQLRDLINKYLYDDNARRTFQLQTLESSRQHTFITRITRLLEICQMVVKVGAGQTSHAEGIGKT